MASSKAEPSANKQVDQPKEVDDVQQLPKTTPAGMSANPLKTGETGGLPQEHHGDSQDPLKVTDIEDTISRIPRAEPETLTPDEDLIVIIGRHEEAIQRRWMQKSKSKRKALLLQVWPGMPSSHRPEIELWRTKFEPGSSLDLSPFKWPYMNLEDLSKTEPLLLLLNSRARFTPDYFTYFDLLSTSFGLKVECTAPGVLEHHFMMFRSRRTPETYGQLYSSEKPFGAESDVATDPTRLWYTAGEGLWVMEIQDRLYSFLVQCCEAILHDVPPELLMPPDDDHLPIRPKSPTMSSSVNSEGIKNAAVASFENLYDAPRNADFFRLASLVKAMQASAEDHLWSLRENPGYLAMNLSLAVDHSIYRLPDVADQHHPLFARNKQDIFWGRIFSEVIGDALSCVDIFGVMYDKITRLCRLLHWENKVSIDKDLPPLLAKALFEFQYSAIRALYSVSYDERFLKSVYGSPPLKMNYRREIPDPDDYDVIQVRPLVPANPNKARDDVEFFFETMGDKYLHFCLSNTGLLDELELLIQRQPAAKAFISSLVADRLATLGMLCECVKQCQLFQPWIIGYEPYQIRYDDELNNDYHDAFMENENLGKLEEDQYWSSLANIIKDRSGSAYVRAARQRRCKESVETMRAAEASVDEFWTKVISTMKRVDAISLRVEEVFARRLKRTEVWIEPANTPKRPGPPEKGKGKGKAKDDAAVLPQFDQLILEARALNEEILKKEKEEASGTSPSFQVDKRTLKVFNALFYDENAGYQQGDIAWKEFVHAMMAVGFSAEKLYGSAWYFFKPSDSEDTQDTQSIIFHEPYMAGKLPFEVHQHYARRLTKTYGWDRETFTLAASFGK
ncbi:hypothetical protein GGS26DRAFT_586636 [Hypomontagnella submonticulosa]|nr:hypothetical protein GGS26DRAFT_586636 [Hypomontagnella submonticulosa]